MEPAAVVAGSLRTGFWFHFLRRSQPLAASDSIFRQRIRIDVPAERSALGLLHDRVPEKIEGASDPQERAQGRPGARCTRGPVCKSSEKSAHEHTGSAEAIRPSLRNGFTAYFALSSARPGLFATVALKKLASQELDTSHWGVRTTRLDV